MRFLHKTGSRMRFQMTHREKQVLWDLLELYPLVPASHHRLTRNENDAKAREAQALLEESLAEEKRENRKELQKLLQEDPARMQRTQGGRQLELEESEVDWLLQVLNDLRVGAWVAQGSPDPRQPRPEAMTEEQTAYHLICELAGQFEIFFLKSLTAGP